MWYCHTIVLFELRQNKEFLKKLNVELIIIPFSHFWEYFRIVQVMI